VAFSEGVDALAESLTLIDEQSQLAQGASGATSVKEAARQALSLAITEVTGALRAYAAKAADPEVAAQAGYSPSEVTSGKANEVVARCRSIHATAIGIESAELAKYGITAAKLTALKKKIDAYDSVKTAPRQSQVERNSALQLLPQLVRSAVAIVRDQLDGLVLQFRAANPNFFEEYFAARVVVDTRGGQSVNEDLDQPKPSPTPTPVPA
jgi:hypothetical protein